MKRSITPITIPKRGTHGVRVDPFVPFWMRQSDEQLLEVFMTLKPYFALEQHRNDSLD